MPRKDIAEVRMIDGIDQCMHLKRQKVGFSIERPELKLNVFLHFINPVSMTYNGKLMRMSANCCYIGTIGEPLYYIAEHLSMLHNFVHFKIADAVEIERLGLPLNTPFYTDMQEDITATVERMEWAIGAKDNISSSFDPSRMFEDLLYRLAQERKTGNVAVGGYNQEHTFDTLRTQLYVDPASWTVKKMAEFVHLSRAHFSVRYKEIFGVTPNADINTAALLCACKLLTTTRMNIGDVGRASGYSGSAYFIKQFKAKYGMTPTEYRRINQFH